MTDSTRGEAKLVAFRKMSDGELIETISGQKADTVTLNAGKYELERRRNRWPSIRSWLSLVISVAAVLIAFLTK